MKYLKSYRVIVGFIAIFLFTSLVSSEAMAGKSKKWRANNHTDQNVKVYWCAAGCAGVEPHCDSAGTNI